MITELEDALKRQVSKLIIVTKIMSYIRIHTEHIASHVSFNPSVYKINYIYTKSMCLENPQSQPKLTKTEIYSFIFSRTNCRWE